jgi:hypothetical protein
VGRPAGARKCGGGDHEAGRNAKVGGAAAAQAHEQEDCLRQVRTPVCAACSHPRRAPIDCRPHPLAPTSVECDDPLCGVFWPTVDTLRRAVRRKENLLGERGAVRCADSSSIAATPMQSDDSGQFVMRKVAPKKRPQWQDINHQDYRCGGSSSAARPQYIERRRPHRISVRTPESARNVLMKELERAEALVKRGKESPNQSARAASESLGDDLKSLRASLGSGKKGQPRSAAVDRQAPAQDQELMESIDALSAVLDCKLALIAEASCEHLASTASTFVAGATSAQQPQIGTSKPPCPVEDYSVPTPPLEDDPVVRSDIGLDDSSDMCLHSDSIDDVDEALANETEANGATGAQGGGEDDAGYDDDFESSLVVAEGEEEGGNTERQVSDDVIDKLNETKKKLDLLERLLTPNKVASVPAVDASAGGHTGGLPPLGEGAGACVTLAPGDAAAAASEATDAAAPGGDRGPQAAPVSRISSKPFSFKNKAGGGAGPRGGVAGEGQGNLMSFFASGPTLLSLNGNQNLGQAPPSLALLTPAPASGSALAGHQAEQRREQVGSMLQPEGGGGAGTHAHAPLDSRVAAAETCGRRDAETGEAQAPGSDALGARAPPAGGRAGRGLLNLNSQKANSASAAPSAVSVSSIYGGLNPSVEFVGSVATVDSAPSSYQPAGHEGRSGRALLDLGDRASARSPLGDGVAEEAKDRHQPVSARGGGGRVGRGLLDFGRQSPDECGVGISAAGDAISRATTASSTASGADHARREWTGSEGGGDGGRGLSAGGKKKINKEEIRRAMLAAQGGAAEPAGEHHEPPPAAPVAGRRRSAEEDPRGAASEPCELNLNLGEMPAADGRGDSQPPTARQFVGGRRGPVRATGPPRFEAGVGAEARAAQAQLAGGGGGGGFAGAGRRSRSPVDNSSSLEVIDLGGGAGGGRQGGAVIRGSVAVVSAQVASVALDSSLDRSLECEEL